jgi:hypothetical protein
VTDAQPYVDKWLAREPEMRLADVFAVREQRAALQLWWTLLNEIDEAVSELREVSVAQAKLAWWGDELLQGTAGEARHPLVRALFAVEAARRVPAECWSELALAAIAAAQDDATPIDVDGLVRARMPLASAIATVETMVFDAAATAADIAVAARVRALRRALITRAAVRLPIPLALVARHQRAQLDLSNPGAERETAPLIADLAQGLLDALDAPAAGTSYRRARRLHDIHLLRSWSRQSTARFEIARLASLRLHWRAARAARQERSSS